MTDNSSKSDAPEGTDAAPTFRGVILRLQSLAPSLSPVARRLAEFIIESPNRVIEMSITELAETAGVSWMHSTLLWNILPMIRAVS
jgi:hypothetical protein